MKKVLIVLDMLEGFVREGYPLYCGTSIEQIVPVIQQIIKDYNQAGDPVFFVADQHAPDDPEFKMFPPHCIKGSKESEVIPELWDLAENRQLFPKTRYGAFYGTNIDQELEKTNPDVVEVVGVCTNICVLFTVEELRNRYYKTIVYSDAVTTFDKNAHPHALEQIQSVLGAEVKERGHT